ncbi:ETEC_3214 domain-containing protein [[Kitasatospora] papulosa]|uniref:ETEC_3214 domain-containing protein n=1 Tax=[Kitasatospora] papulosa TaxID=1464011 RepID=UPI003689E58D
MPFLPVIDTKLNVWTLTAVLTALYTLYGVARGWWQASLGKRRRLIRAYRRLAPYVRHDYVTEQFGEPAWEHKQTVRKYGTDGGENDSDVVLEDDELTVRTWPLGLLGYLVTWCTEHDEVLMYSLTTRSRLFRPRMSVGPYRVTLGRTPLAALSDPDLDASGPWHELGARRFSYAEQHYFGNPGGYLYWAVGVSDAGTPSAPPIGCEGDTWSVAEVAEYRRVARINSVLVIGSTIELESVLPRGIAPDYDTVRLLELRHPARVTLSARLHAIRGAVERRKNRKRVGQLPVSWRRPGGQRGEGPDVGVSS